MKKTIIKIGLGILWVIFILSSVLFIGEVSAALERGGFFIVERNLSDYLGVIASVSGIALLVIYLSKSGYWPIRTVTKRQAEILDRVNEWDESEGVNAEDDEDLKEVIDKLIYGGK